MRMKDIEVGKQYKVRYEAWPQTVLEKGIKSFFGDRKNQVRVRGRSTYSIHKGDVSRIIPTTKVLAPWREHHEKEAKKKEDREREAEAQSLRRKNVRKALGLGMSDPLDRNVMTVPMVDLERIAGQIEEIARWLKDAVGFDFGMGFPAPPEYLHRALVREWLKDDPSVGFEEWAQLMSDETGWPVIEEK